MGLEFGPMQRCILLDKLADGREAGQRGMAGAAWIH